MKILTKTERKKLNKNENLKKSETINFQKVKWQEGKAQIAKQVRPIKTELKGFGDAFFKALDGNFIERR